MNIKNRLIQNFYNSTKSSMNDFIEYLPAILPVTDDDAKTLSVALDMVKQLKDTLDNAESVRELEDIIDLELLREEWDYDQNRLMAPFSGDCQDEIQRVIDEFSIEEE